MLNCYILKKTNEDSNNALQRSRLGFFGLEIEPY